MAWVDGARGLAVIAVVLMHLSAFQFEPIVKDLASPAYEVWAEISQLLGLVRMPTLLIITGWLATSRIRMGLGSARLRHSIASNLYLYLVWFVIYGIVGTCLLDSGLDQQVVFDDTVVRELFLPQTTLWYLAALTLYLSVFAALNRVPPWLLLGLTLAAGWVADLHFAANPEQWARIPGYAAFFVVGSVCRGLWPVVAARPILAVTAGATFLTVEQTRQPGGELDYLVIILLGVLGVCAVFGAVSWLTRHAPALNRPLAAVGRRTLVVYVMHFPIVMILAADPPWVQVMNRAVLGNELGRWLYLPVATVVVVSLCLAMLRMADWLRARWLFRFPMRTPASH